MAKKIKETTTTEELSESPAPEKKAKISKKSVKTPGHSKRYLAAAKKVSPGAHLLDEALTIVKELANAKFDETIEAHFRLGIDPKQTSQNVRGSVKLPHGTGKSIRILVFAEGAQAEEAKKAGAVVATDEIVAQIEKGSVAFEIVIATPSQMPKIAKLARILGVRGLMPNPRNGTVTDNIAEVVAERGQGLIDFKNQDNLLHIGFGKASFSTEQLKDNFEIIYQAVLAGKPAKISGDYLKASYVASTMGPAVKLDLTVTK